MRILATGVAGFIGSRVAELLVEQGHEVCGVDNLCAAYDVRLKEYRLGRLRGIPGLDFRLGDISDNEAISAIWQECGPFDAVVNLAARAGVRQSVQDPWVYISTNVTGTLNLLELCRRDGVGKFVLASTSSLYGGANPMRPRRKAPRRCATPITTCMGWT
jgi:UDP-glucuronate 4-epimerase